MSDATRTLYVQLSPELHREAKVRAARDDQTLAALVTEALRSYLASDSNANPDLEERSNAPK